jgi:Mg-chelatase subunit ChlD
MEYEAAHLYIMLDASTSMVDNEVDDMTRWQFVTGGIRDFLDEADLKQVQVSLQFFGWLNDSSCDSLNYSLPEVALGDIDDVAADMVLALEEQIPGGLTPTYPALSGALSYAKSYAQMNPDHYNAVVFITDGYPTRCAPMDLPSIAALAMQAHELAPSVATHIVGIDGSYNMDQIAMAGGTGSVLVLDNHGSVKPVRDALYAIATDRLQAH